MGSPVDYFQLGTQLIRNIASLEDKMTVMQLTDRIRVLQEERDGLARQVRELSEELARKKRLETRAGASYVLEDDGAMTGPICKRCYDERDLVIRLVRCPGGARCVNCGETYPGVESDIDDMGAGTVL